MKADPTDLMTMGQVAEMLHRPSLHATRQWLTRWVSSDPIYVGKQRLVTRAEVIAAIERASRTRVRNLRLMRRAS